MLFIDTFEPVQIEKLVGQSIPVSRTTLNGHGLADYVWNAIDGHVIQVERKQIDEILSDMDRVEEQLRREMVNAVETILLYEGTFEPIPAHKGKSACQSFRKAKDGKIMVVGHKYNVSYIGVQAWFSQLDKAGITIVNTIDYIATAFTLVALYNNSKKEEHTTFKRYIKPKIYPTPFNPQVETLMSIKGVELGEKKALALISRYGTVWQVLHQDAEELAQTEGVGIKIAKDLLKAIGREI